MTVTVAPSARLSYRLMDLSDGDYLFELDQDPRVMKFLTGGKPTSREEVEQVFLPRLKAYRNPAAGWGLWMVFESSSGEYLGWILVRPLDFFTDSPAYDNLELGWRFKYGCWGQGIATEAAQAVMSALRQQSDVSCFTALAVEDNLASIKVMTKLGMQYQKTDIHRDPLGDLEVVYYRVEA